MIRYGRHINWHLDLERAIRELEHMVFEWGTHDCCTASAHVVEQLIGVDIMAEDRDYKGDREALVKMRTAGGLDQLIANAAERYGLEEVDPCFAQRGDLVLMDHNARESAGVVWFDGSVVCATEPRGVTFLPIKDAYRAWRVQ